MSDTGTMLVQVTYSYLGQWVSETMTAAKLMDTEPCKSQEWPRYVPTDHDTGHEQRATLLEHLANMQPCDTVPCSIGKARVLVDKDGKTVADRCESLAAEIRAMLPAFGLPSYYGSTPSSMTGLQTPVEVVAFVCGVCAVAPKNENRERLRRAKDNLAHYIYVLSEEN